MNGLSCHDCGYILLQVDEQVEGSSNELMLMPLWLIY